MVYVKNDNFLTANVLGVFVNSYIGIYSIGYVAYDLNEAQSDEEMLKERLDGCALAVNVFKKFENPMYF